MPPQAPWSPNAHAFAQHQFSHVVNFWKQGRKASFRLEALPGGHAELNITFQLPQAADVIPPPTHVPSVVPPRVPPQCSIPPLFPNGWVTKGPGGANSKSQAPPKKVSSRLRRSYQRSVLHKAALAAPSLPPPENGSLRQAALACVQRQQAVSASPVNTPSTKKRPLSDSLSALSPPNLPPLAQRIRSDIQIGESENDSPERELLRSQSFPGNSSPQSSPGVKEIPPPAPLVFTPSKSQDDTEVEVEVSDDKDNLSCWNCDAEMTPDHQCKSGGHESESECVEEEDVEKTQRLEMLVQKLLDVGRKPKCPNCEELFSSGHHAVTHQC